jgi:hypothetical protein
LSISTVDSAAMAGAAVSDRSVARIRVFIGSVLH